MTYLSLIYMGVASSIGAALFCCRHISLLMPEDW